MFQQLEVKEKKRSNKARNGLIEIGEEKAITIPTYGISVQKQFEVELITSKQFTDYENIGIISSKFYNAWKIFREKEGRKNMLNLNGKYVEQNYISLKKEKIWFFDPCTDEIYYKNPVTKEGILKCELISQKLKDILLSMEGENYNSSWRDLMENTSLSMKFIREFVTTQAKLNADIILPPVPMITADSPDYIIDIWHKIMKTTGVLAKTLAEKNSTILINLNVNLFKRPTKLKLIIQKLLEISSEDSISDMKTIIIKIQKSEVLESETAETRLRFKKFIEGMANYASFTNRALILLDESSLGLACISIGVDGFVEPLNGVTGVGIAFSKEKRGRYYHPEGLKFVGFQDIKEYYQNNRDNLPCNCSFCSNINGKNLDRDISIKEWNLSRRGHLLESRNEEIGEYHKTIRENTTTNAIIDKIQRSDVKNFLDLLPK